MARKNYPDEFKRDAVALYRDTEGATITVIAAELGVSEATLSAWCKSAGVPIRHRRGVVAPCSGLAPVSTTRGQRPLSGVPGTNGIRDCLADAYAFDNRCGDGLCCRGSIAISLT
ncbi:transposase [Mycobacterium intracellulare]|uniref:transposase n=1 Tax=Mycobacterium intracellulare TaxID=1767 RepID=UPI000B5DA250|nr:transposase [Mycobacterium intracellulare]MCV7323036.1 transposase [Mycobacterium intracellulare subsp. chimaera]